MKQALSNIRLFLVLLVLFAVSKANATVFADAVQLSDLKVGDILVAGASVSQEGKDVTVTFPSTRHKSYKWVIYDNDDKTVAVTTLTVERDGVVNCLYNGNNLGLYPVTAGATSENDTGNAWEISSINTSTCEISLVGTIRNTLWEGQGTQANPYKIQNAAEWNTLSKAVIKSTDAAPFKGVYFQLANDLTIKEICIGNESKPFCGIFDGNNCTLTFKAGGLQGGTTSIRFYEDYCAPFILLNGATIQHLRVAGVIYSKHRQAAGIACFIDGDTPTVIDDCKVAGTLWASSALQDDASFGGFVAEVKSTCTAGPTIKDCSFSGLFKGYPNLSGGFIGWTSTPATFDKCTFEPVSVADYEGCATFYRSNDGVTCPMKECYATETFGKSQGQYLFHNVTVPLGCSVEMVSTPTMVKNGVKYYASGSKINLTVPEDTQFDHWVTSSTNGSCFINDPWTAGGIHTLSDVRAHPTLSIATSMPEPYTSDRQFYGITYRYLTNRDYLLFMSDSLRQARGFRFDDDGECYAYDGEGTKCYITVVWGCNPDAANFKNKIMEGWLFAETQYTGAILTNDLAGTAWDHTILFGIAPRAFQNVSNLQRLVFISNQDQGVLGKANCKADLNITIQEQAFKGSGIEELVMMYYNRDTEKWEKLGPQSTITIADNAFEGTVGKISVDPSVYQDFMGDSRWAPLYGRFSIYAAKVEDMKVEGAVYSYWRDDAYNPLKNDAEGHKKMMEVLKYWNSEYRQFNAASVLTNSSKNIWYTQVTGCDNDYLKSNDGVMRIYNDPGSQYNYKNIAIQSLGQSKDVKAIAFYQTNGLSDNSYTDPKMVIQNNAFYGCDNLKELRLFYYVEDGEDRWQALEPSEIIPGDNIFGLKRLTEEELADPNYDFSKDPKMPANFKILVSPEYYQDFLKDRNWARYSAFIEPVDYSPGALKDFTKNKLTYAYMASPGGIMQTSQVVSQDVSWWTAPRIALEVALYAASFGLWKGVPSQFDIDAATEALNHYAQEKAPAQAASTAAINTSKAISGANGNFLTVSIAIDDDLAYNYASRGLQKLNGIAVKDLTSLGLSTNNTGYTTMLATGLIENGKVVTTQKALDKLTSQQIIAIAKYLQQPISDIAMPAVEAMEIAVNNSADVVANWKFQGNLKKLFEYRMKHWPLMAKALASTAATVTTAGMITSASWGGNSYYNQDMMLKGMRDNIYANIHQVGVTGGGYVITTPSKNIIYHTYVKEADPSLEDAVIYAGFDDDNNSNTSNRTMALGRNTFRNHKKLKTVRFHSMEGQTSNAAMSMMLSIPDSAFVGCDNLVEFSTLLRDNEGGTRALGPENFILAGDSIFAGLDSTKFHIIIDPLRKDDFVNSQTWGPLKRFFAYEAAKPKTKYTVYGVEYAYNYEGNSIKKEHKESGHLIEHTVINGVNNDWLSRYNGGVTLYNDIGTWNNYQLDAIMPWAFQGNDKLRTVKFTDIHYSFTENPVAGDVYTGLQFAMQDSCFAKCPNLETVDLIYAINDGTDHIEPMTLDMVKIGSGVFDGSPKARLKMMPQQAMQFANDSTWSDYKDRFLPVVFMPGDEGIQDALDDLEFFVNDNQYNHYYDYVDLSLLPKNANGTYNFAWLDGKFTEEKDNIRSFADFKLFEHLGLDYVGQDWFNGCTKLTNIVLPSTIKTIKYHAFRNCQGLSEIEIPASVTKIETEAFAQCDALKTIVVRSDVPATIGSNYPLPTNEGMKIYVPADKVETYKEAWVDYAEYIVGADTYKVKKVVKVKTPGTLAEELGLNVEWDNSGLYEGQEPRYINSNYTKIDSLTVSGPLNNLDLWVIRYLAGNSGYEKGGLATDGKLKYLNLYDASIKADDSCEANFYNAGGFGNGWIKISLDNKLPSYCFHGCTALETVILPSSITEMSHAIFDECSNLKRVAITSAVKDYEDWQSLEHMITSPLEELVFCTDGHAKSSCKDPWGQSIGVVYTYKSTLPDYLNDICITAKTENIVAPFEDDGVWRCLIDHGEFFPSQFLNKEDIGQLFSRPYFGAQHMSKFDEFKMFNKVKELHGTFYEAATLNKVTLPSSIELIDDDAFKFCFDLRSITFTSDSVPELIGDPFRTLPGDYVLYVPRHVVKVYRTKWPQYADHINPSSTLAGSDDIIVVNLMNPNTLAKELGLEAKYSTDMSSTSHKLLSGVYGDYTHITRLKINGLLGASDFDLLRYLAGYCPWADTQNYSGHLEYLDLYDAWTVIDNEYALRSYYRRWDGTSVPTAMLLNSSEIPQHAFLRAYNLKTLILPRSCKKVNTRAFQECEGLETLVVGEEIEDFNWNALDDDANLSRMFILAKNKMGISTEFPVWRWLCNNYNPTFDAFYVRPSLYKEYLNDEDYVGRSWQRTNNISKGMFDSDDEFVAFASHAAATEDDLATVTSVDGWFNDYKNIKDLTPLQYTMVDSLSKATLAPLTKLEKIALPLTLTGMEDGLFDNAKQLRYVDFLQCDSTDIVSKLHDGGLQRLGIDNKHTLVYVPKAYGESDGDNIVSYAGGRLYAKAFCMTDTLDYMVPYSFETDSVKNTRTMSMSEIPYTICLPYKMKIPSYCRAYMPGGREGAKVVFKEVTGELEAFQPYLLRVVGNKRLRKTSAKLDSDIQQTIKANSPYTIGEQVDVPGYALVGTTAAIDNKTAAEMGAFTLHDDGDWYAVQADSDPETQETIQSFRAYMLPSTHFSGAKISMILEDLDEWNELGETTDIENIGQSDNLQSDDDAIYDLNGRKVAEGKLSNGQLPKGIYIQNGKKIVIK